MGRFHRRRESPRRKILSAATVAADFGVASAVAREGVAALSGALEETGSYEVAAARRQWLTALRAAYGDDRRRLEKGLDDLAAAYPVHDGRDPLALLFAVQTYYVLVVKFLIWEVAAGARRSDSPAQAILDTPGGDQLLQRMLTLESENAGARSHGSDAGSDSLTWYTRAWSRPIGDWLRRLAEAWSQYDFSLPDEEAACAGDMLQKLYQGVFPKRFRHVLGEYYTPGWLVDQMLDEAGYAGDPAARLLDPACGSGGFLVSAIHRLRIRWGQEYGGEATHREALLRAILSSVVGIDLNPLAVVTARANYLIAIRDLLSPCGRVEAPVFLGDSILGRLEGLHDLGERFDYVVGNPPWIAWDDLASELREATKPLWQQYGLFTLSGRDARHGGGKKDLSTLMIYAAADRYLKSSGRLAMVVTQTVFQTRGAGDGFRRFRLGTSGPWLKVVQVSDLVEARPFAATANWTATLVLEKGSPTTYPVPYAKYAADRSRRDYDALPIDPHRPTSPWFLWPRGTRRPLAELIGPSEYQAHLGANTGGANGVYWVTLPSKSETSEVSKTSEVCDCPPRSCDKHLVRVRNLADRGKRLAAAADQLIESELHYPLLRWGDVRRFHAVPAVFLLLAQDAQTRRGIAEPSMRSRYPNAYAYLTQFREVLERRAAYRRYQSRAAFYSMYNVGPYTLAPIKVVWRRMDRRINAAVVEPVDDPWLGLRPVIPQETCALVAADSADEAHYLCAVLNSAPVGFLVASHSVRGGKSFGSPGMLDFLRIRRYDPGNSIHRELAAASRRAHGVAAVRKRGLAPGHRVLDIALAQEVGCCRAFPDSRLAACGDDEAGIQDHIDRLAARLWGIDPVDIPRG